MEEIVTLAHGSGGSATEELIREIFIHAFGNNTLRQMEDAAVLPWNSKTLAFTTDSFVITPLEFHGGDIGRLSVCGTVNDLLMRGAVPKYLTCGWVIEEGTEVRLLQRLAQSMAQTAIEAGIQIVAGDTKVVEHRQGGIFINTSGIGTVADGVEISARNTHAGDVILVSGTMGDHHAAILSSRMMIENNIRSDAAPLTEMVDKLRNLPVHAMRDVTRGGLATVCKELAIASGKTFVLHAPLIPIKPQIKDFCGLLGLDPLYMGNEGKLVCTAKADAAEEVLHAMKYSRYGESAAIIGEVTEIAPGKLFLETEIGGRRELDVLQGEGLPRIC